MVVTTRLSIQVQSLSIPLSMFSGIDKSSMKCQLYGFCDASSIAYATDVYMKIQTPLETVVHFVTSKNTSGTDSECYNTKAGTTVSSPSGKVNHGSFECSDYLSGFISPNLLHRFNSRTILD